MISVRNQPWRGAERPRRAGIAYCCEQRFYWSKNFQPGVAFSNGSHYARAEVDAALEAAAVETDPQRWRALYAQFQALVQADLPELPLSVLRQVTISQRRVRRHTVTIDGIRGNFAETCLESA